MFRLLPGWLILTTAAFQRALSGRICKPEFDKPEQQTAWASQACHKLMSLVQGSSVLWSLGKKKQNKEKQKRNPKCIQGNEPHGE